MLGFSKEKLTFVGEHDGLAIGIAHWRLAIMEKVAQDAFGSLREWTVG